MNKNQRSKSQLYYIALVILFVLIFGYAAINIFDFGSTGKAFEITASCSDNNTILKMDELTGGHAGLWNSLTYANKVCYTASSGHSCAGSNTVIRLSGSDNAHAEKNNMTTAAYSDVCFGNLVCAYAAACTGSYECIASISNNTNAHIGDCNAYSEKICCRRGNGQPIISGLQLQQTVPEDSLWPLNLAQYISDPDNDPLTLTTNSSKVKVNGNILTFNYTLPVNESIKLTVSDGILNSSANINIIVNATNDPPVLGAIGSLTAIANQLFTRRMNATDEDSSSLAFSANTTLFSIAGGIINFTPASSQNGTYSINISVSDGQAIDYEIISFTIVDTNRPPVITNFTPQNTTINTTKGTMIFFNFTAYDPDGTIPSQRWVKDDTMDLSAEQSMRYNVTSGTHTVKLVITDGLSEVSQTWTISAPVINSPPILVMPVPDQTITGNKTNAMNLNDYFTDPDGDHLTYSAAASAKVKISIIDGVVSFYPATTAATTERITFMASDSIATATSNEVSLSITQVTAPAYKCGNNILDTGEECDGTKNQACKGLNCKSDCTCAKAQVPSCTPNWQCNTWSTCASGKQARTCTDANNCNNLAGKPSEQQSCAINVQPTPITEQPAKIEKPWWQALLYILIAVVVLGAAAVGGLVFYKQQSRKKKIAAERQRLLQQQEMMKAETQRENELRRYIADTLNKGFTQDQIRRRLIETGWNPAVVDRNVMVALPKKQLQPLLKLRPFEQVMQQKQEERKEMFTEFEEKKEAGEELKPLPLKEEKTEKAEEAKESFKKLSELTKDHSPFERLARLRMK
ncbi:hypothetical protein HYU07_07525 [Candidatus Woesearchaeota archaeon]|nr:hypothetical protein [Candidatus Woesearchaeota archaeon]